MISYGSGVGEPDWHMLFRVSGSVFPRCFVIVLPLALFAALLKLLFDNGIFLEFTAMAFVKSGPAWAGFNTLVNFVVVFRLSAAYSKFWSAYTTTAAMLGDWCCSATSVVSFCRQSTVDDQDLESFLQTIVRLFSMLSACALQELSPRQYLKICGLQTLDAGSIDATSLKALDGSPMRVELCYYWILQLFVDNQASGVIAAPPPIVSRCFAELQAGMGKFLDAKRHAQTQFNFPYAQSTRWLIIFYSGFMPLMMVQWSDWVSGAFAFTFLQLFFIWALYMITVILESPFDTSNPNSIDTFVLQRRVNSSLLLLLDPQTRSRPPVLEKSADKSKPRQPKRKKWMQDFAQMQKGDTIHKAALLVDGWQLVDDKVLSTGGQAEAFVDLEAGSNLKSKCVRCCICCSSEAVKPSEIAISGRYCKKRFGIIDGDKTAVIPVCIRGDKLFVAVPFQCSQPKGASKLLEVETKSGSTSTVLIKAVSIQDRHKFHKQRAVKWSPGEYKDFAFEYQNLVSAVYSSKILGSSMPSSKVSMEEEIICDEEMDDAKAADKQAIGINAMVMLMSREVFCSHLEKCGLSRDAAEKEWSRRKGLPRTYNQGHDADGNVTIELNVDLFKQECMNKKQRFKDSMDLLETAQNSGKLLDLEATVKMAAAELPRLLQEDSDLAMEELQRAESILAEWRALEKALDIACEERNVACLRLALQNAKSASLKSDSRAAAQELLRQLEMEEAQTTKNRAVLITRAGERPLQMMKTMSSSRAFSPKASSMAQREKKQGGKLEVKEEAMNLLVVLSGAEEAATPTQSATPEGCVTSASDAEVAAIPKKQQQTTFHKLSQQRRLRLVARRRELEKDGSGVDAEDSFEMK
eukprot:TRINITY_DN19136_c0_g2_i1.p1 TRINITY_DN19136_c0_g2~~TRINITY_DN19136_c0_g2_i1.p1  ORF type:complete len:863 (+),score=176.51 TRINITY_DN19136_c0_g2_i1:52-2640(+)